MLAKEPGKSSSRGHRKIKNATENQGTPANITTLPSEGSEISLPLFGPQQRRAQLRTQRNTARTRDKASERERERGRKWGQGVPSLIKTKRKKKLEKECVKMEVYK